MEVSCNSVIHGDTLEILGTEMALRADIWGRTVITFKPHTKAPGSVGRSNLDLSLQLFKVLGSTASTFLKSIGGVVKVKAHYSFISSFVESIASGTRPPTTAEDGLTNVRFLEAVCEQI
jgi:hypothetical protein